MKKSNYLKIACASLALASLPASAAITVVGTPTSTFVASGGAAVPNLTLANYDPSGADKLVVVTSTERGTAITPQVTFGGTALTFVAGSGPVRDAGIYYLDLPSGAAAADIVLSYLNSGGTTQLPSNGAALGVFALSGTANGGPVSTPFAGAPSVSSDVASQSYTTASDGEFFVAAFAQNGNVTGAGAVAGTDLTGLANGSLGSSSYGFGSALLGAAGTADIDLFTADGGQDQQIAIASFAAIPEPSSALLGGLGMLFLLRRRR